MSDPVAEFERRFAKLIGSEYCIAVNSGTSALHAALEAIDVRHGEVIMPALCPAMDAFAIIHAGAWPIFADVDPQTHLVTHETLAKVIGPRTKAIVAVALHGLPCDIEPILALAKPRSIAVIEDCAQCLLGRYRDGFAGTRADIGCFSFERKKHLTTGSEGGAIVSNNPLYAKRARKFAGLGYKHMTAETGRTSLNAAEFQHPGYQRFDTIGLNYRMSWAQAEAGLIALKDVRDAVWRRQEIGYLWQQALGCQLQPHSYDADNTFYSAAVEYEDAILDCMDDRNRWKELYDKFVSLGGDGFYAMPQLPYNEPALEDEYRGLEAHPIAERLQQRLMLFKTHYKSLTVAKEQADILSGMLNVNA